jgi:ecotin
LVSRPKATILRPVDRFPFSRFFEAAMSTRSIPLSQYRIEEPCTEAWDAMHEAGAGRHCDKCSKKVHDLSAMDQAEVDALLAGAATKPVCVRMRQDAAGRIMARDYWKVAAGVALAVGVGGGEASAQDAPVKLGEIRRVEGEKVPQPPIVMGKVCAPQPQPAPPRPPVVMGLVCVKPPPPAAPADPAKDIKMFPAAKEGFKRVVIRLPKMDDEAGAQVEIVATRIENVDAVNRHSIGGALEAKNLEGWGYTYYELAADKAVAGTLMAGPDEAMRPRPTPVGIHGKGFQGLRYNSRLPLVLYVPVEVEVKYRVWTPGEAKPVVVE